MDLKLSLFIVDFFVILMSSFMVITINNPIFSVLFLIIVYITSSLLFILSGIKFIGFTLLIVYLGAVVVLFLFIVMLLNIKILELRRNINFYPFLFICISFFILIIFFGFFPNTIFNFYYSPVIFEFIYIDWLNIYFLKESFNVVGETLYTYFYLYLILAAIILFIAMIGAIVLTITQIHSHKKQLAYLQLIRTRDTIFLI